MADIKDAISVNQHLMLKYFAKPLQITITIRQNLPNKAELGNGSASFVNDLSGLHQRKTLNNT